MLQLLSDLLHSVDGSRGAKPEEQARGGWGASWGLGACWSAGWGEGERAGRLLTKSSLPSPLPALLGKGPGELGLVIGCFLLSMVLGAAWACMEPYTLPAMRRPGPLVRDVVLSTCCQPRNTWWFVMRSHVYSQPGHEAVPNATRSCSLGKASLAETNQAPSTSSFRASHS